MELKTFERVALLPPSRPAQRTRLDCLSVRYESVCEGQRMAEQRNLALLQDLSDLKHRVKLSQEMVTSQITRFTSLKSHYETFVSTAYSEWLKAVARQPPASQQPDPLITYPPTPKPHPPPSSHDTSAVPLTTPVLVTTTSLLQPHPPRSHDIPHGHQPRTLNDELPSQHNPTSPVHLTSSPVQPQRSREDTPPDHHGNGRIPVHGEEDLKPPTTTQSSITGQRSSIVQALSVNQTSIEGHASPEDEEHVSSEEMESLEEEAESLEKEVESLEDGRTGHSEEDGEISAIVDAKREEEPHSLSSSLSLSPTEDPSLSSSPTQSGHDSRLPIEDISTELTVEELKTADSAVEGPPPTAEAMGVAQPHPPQLQQDDIEAGSSPLLPWQPVEAPPTPGTVSLGDISSSLSENVEIPLASGEARPAGGGLANEEEDPVSLATNEEEDPASTSTNDNSSSAAKEEAAVSVTVTTITNLLTTLNTHLRNDAESADLIYTLPSTSDNMKSQINHSQVLAASIVKVAAGGHDLITFEPGAVSMVLLQQLRQLTSSVGGLLPRQLMDEDAPLLTSLDELSVHLTPHWSSVWPSLSEHVQLIMSCGHALQEISATLVPALVAGTDPAHTEKACLQLISVFQSQQRSDEKGESLSLSQDMTSELSEPEDGNPKLKNDGVEMVMTIFGDADLSDHSSLVSEGSAIAEIEKELQDIVAGGSRQVKVQDSSVSGHSRLSGLTSFTRSPPLHLHAPSDSETPDDDDTPQSSPVGYIPTALEQRSVGGVSALSNHSSLKRRLGLLGDSESEESDLGDSLLPPTTPIHSRQRQGRALDQDDFDFYA